MNYEHSQSQLLKGLCTY